MHRGTTVLIMRLLHWNIFNYAIITQEHFHLCVDHYGAFSIMRLILLNFLSIASTVQPYCNIGQKDSTEQTRVDIRTVKCKDKIMPLLLYSVLK